MIWKILFMKGLGTGPWMISCLDDIVYEGFRNRSMDD